MIQIDKYTKRYKTAIERRNNPHFIAKLDFELKSADILDQLSILNQPLDDITKVSDFEKKEEAIKTFFNQLYERITSPGLDAFIQWIGSQTTSQNPTNIRDLKKFLKDNYDHYAGDIENVLSAKDIVSSIDGGSIFKKLLSSFDNKMKKIITDFVDNKTFENEIDGFLNTLKTEYNKVSVIEELSYTQFDQLFSEEQRQDSTIDFYSDIFDIILRKHQSLDIRKGEDKNTNYYTRILNRISSIKKCIGVLNDTNVSKNGDEQIKALFLKFQKEMPIVEDDYLQSLKEFVNKDWESLYDKYENILDFYSETPLEFNNNQFDGLKRSAELTNLINSYRLLIKEGNINIVPSSTTADIKSALNKKNKSIYELNQEVQRIKALVKEEFNDFIIKYEKQKSMLKKSIEAYPSLQDEFDSIYGEDGNLDNLKNGIAEYFSEDSSLLVALSNDGIVQMIDLMEATTNKFEETLKQTGLKEPIEWLDSLENLELSVNTMDSDKIKLLLSRGLITLTIDRTYK